MRGKAAQEAAQEAAMRGNGYKEGRDCKESNRLKSEHTKRIHCEQRLRQALYTMRINTALSGKTASMRANAFT